MLAAVDFDDQAMPSAGEVSDEIPDRVLPPESVTGQAAVSQNGPKPPLGIRRLAP